MFASIAEACRVAGLRLSVERDPRGLVLEVHDPAGNLMCRTFVGEPANLDQAAVNIALYLKPLLSIEPIHDDADQTAEPLVLTVDDILDARPTGSAVEGDADADVHAAVEVQRDRAEREAQTALWDLEFALEQLRWLEQTDWSDRRADADLNLLDSVAGQVQRAGQRLARTPAVEGLVPDELLMQLRDAYWRLTGTMDRLPRRWSGRADLGRHCDRLRDALRARGVDPG